MRFALFTNETMEANSWWETETEWHRKWKDLFPQECQEVIKYDDVSGEKHIADVYTKDGIVIEFQHSHITAQERESRERFYKKMFWVVDGTRLKRDYLRFRKAFDQKLIYQTSQKGCFYIKDLCECFSQDWINSTVPVVFDFKGLLENENNDPFLESIWCLLPKNNMRKEYIKNGYLVTKTIKDLLVRITKEDFINNISDYYNYFQS